MKIALAASHGGHLSELRALRPALEGHDLFWISYRAPTTTNCDCVVENIGTSPWRLLTEGLRIRSALKSFRPDVVISSGAEIALPALFWGRRLGARTLYLECSARVTTPSRAGRWLLHRVDEFWVQWPGLAEVYGPPAVYRGSTF